MAQIPSHIKDILTDYVKELSREIKVRSAILFGSYASSQWQTESDIDIAIFSDYFSGRDRAEAIAFLLERAMKYNIDIQPIAFEENDFENAKDNPFINEIVTTGIRIF